MTKCHLLRYLYLAYLSQPRGDRWLYRQLRTGPQRIVQLGIGDGERTSRLLEVALRMSDQPLQFVGVDLFEAAGPDEGHLSLKEAHRRLKSPQIKIQLAPGTADAALPRLANSLTGTDLLLITADTDQAAMQRAWLFIPRMLHEQSQVYREVPLADSECRWEQVSRDEIERLAGQQRHRRRAA